MVLDRKELRDTGASELTFACRRGQICCFQGWFRQKPATLLLVELHSASQIAQFESLPGPSSMVCLCNT